MTQQIYTLMPKVAAAIGAVGKAGRNEQQNYNFRGIDDMLNAVHNALAEHEVSVFPQLRSLLWSREVTSKQGGAGWHVGLEIAYKFVAPDGSHDESVVIGEAMDYSDKASNKAMSAAMKYGLIQTFTVPTADLADGDRHSPEAVNRQAEREVEVVPQPLYKAWVDRWLAKRDAMGHSALDIEEIVLAATQDRTGNVTDLMNTEIPALNAATKAFIESHPAKG